MSWKRGAGSCPGRGTGEAAGVGGVAELRDAALSHAVNVPGEEVLAAPDVRKAADLVLFWNAVLVGLPEVRRVPDVNTKPRHAC